MGATTKVPEYDEILETVGEFGRWQKLLFLLMCIPSAASAMAVFMYSFIAFTPDHRCAIDSCNDHLYQSSFINWTTPHKDGKWSSCSVYQYDTDSKTCPPESLNAGKKMSCPNGWVYNNSLFPSTATEEMDMVCQSEWQNSFSQSMYMLGMLLGSFIFGLLADKYGRKPALMLGSVCLALSGSLSALLPASFPLFATLRLFSGMGHVGTFIMAFTLSVEYVGATSRLFTGCLIEVPFAIGGLIVGFLSWGGLRNWRTLQLVCSAPCILMCAFWWIIPESPRWLIAKGNFEQLEKDVRKTAKVNKTEFPTWAFSSTALKSGMGDTEANGNKPSKKEEAIDEEVDKATLIDLFRPAKIGVRTMAMFYNWLVTTMCYYGLTMAASSLSDNIFLNYTLLILVEIPANILVYLLMDKVGRKPILSGCQILSGVACVAAGLLGSVSWLQVTLSLVGKFGATGSFAIVFVYTAEMFPTEIRSTAVGTSSTCARIGGILAPQVALLSKVWLPMPLLVMGGSAFVGGVIAILLLPETLGYSLPETMDEALALGSRRKDSDISQLVAK